MPNRLIREGWVDSEAINKISSDAERLYLRLHLTGDDAGRNDGRISVLASRCFPLKVSLRVNDVARWLNECVREGLAISYEWDGKPFVQLTKVQRSSPAQVSKYPWKDGSHRIEYVKKETRDGLKEFVTTSLADPIPMGCLRDRNPLDPLSRKCTETETETDTVMPNGAEFVDFWTAYPKKVAKDDAVKAWNKLKPDSALLKTMIEAIERQKSTDDWKKDKGQFIPYPATWLNGRRWEDELVGTGDRSWQHR